MRSTYHKSPHAVSSTHVLPRAAVSQVYYLTFMCASTCFGRFLAHHQELTTALAARGC